MTAVYEPPGCPPETVAVDVADGLHVPDGWRVEVVEGVIAVSPMPDWEHHKIIRAIVTTWGAAGIDASHGDVGFCLRPGHCRGSDGSHVIPDVFVARRAPNEAEIGAAGHHANWMSASMLALVGEVTSSDPYNDRGPKARAYARADIPVYLLIDRDFGKAVVHTLPGLDREGHPVYRARAEFDLAERIVLPPPYPELELGAIR
ncbi:Uma2 family endonuclease [Embleya sp. NPDC001921]